MAIPMANANVPATGRGVLADQAGAPVLAARGTGAAGAPDVRGETFGLALQAEANDADVAGEQPETVEAGDSADTALPEAILLFEDGDASDARRGRREGETAQAQTPAQAQADGGAAITAPAMQALPLAFNAPGVQRMPTAETGGDIALRLGTTGGQDRPAPVLVFAPRNAAGTESTVQDASPLPAGSVGAQALPTGITLSNGLTLNVQPLLQAASANGTGLTSGPAGSRNALVEQLGERLHVQLTQRSEHALIRLDPPSMGRIEILITQEGGNTQVQMRASNPEVARQLHAIGDQLRQDLVQRQHGEVSVQVQDGWRDGEGRGRQRQSQQAAGHEEPGRALHEEDTESDEAPRFALQS